MLREKNEKKKTFLRTYKKIDFCKCELLVIVLTEKTQAKITALEHFTKDLYKY